MPMPFLLIYDQLKQVTLFYYKKIDFNVKDLDKGIILFIIFVNPYKVIVKYFFILKINQP